MMTAAAVVSRAFVNVYEEHRDVSSLFTTFIPKISNIPKLSRPTPVTEGALWGGMGRGGGVVLVNKLHFNHNFVVNGAT